MSGHNKWSQIKRQKEKTDSAKSKIFGKFSRLITEEVKKAKGNLEAPGLKRVVERARVENMSSDNIDRAIKKATTDKSGIMESIVYEAYGPGGCGIIIEVLTSNRNKAAQEIKFILNKHGFPLASIGSVSWAYEKKETSWNPVTTISLSEENLKKLELLVDELENNEEVQEVVTNC